MANCHAAQLQRALPSATVVATVRTGKNLPWLYRRSLRVARHVIANSEFARRTLVAPEDAASRCTVIPNALLHAALLDIVPAPAEPPILLCVAQFRPEKSQRELLEIAAALPRERPWRLAFVGDGPTRAACERQSAALGLSHRVAFLGWQADPAQYYRTASIAVLTSQRESLPNFLVEAQCAGLPVVSYEVGGAAECVRVGETGQLIPAGDRARFTAVLTDLLVEPARRAAMSAAAKAWARAQFSPDRQVTAHLELFARLLDR
jgi:glycosyltransferase involved in cell wall biosynthesis